MARHTVGPRRTDSLRTYVRATRIIGGLSVLVLSGAIAWDLANDEFWAHHALFTGLVASLIVVAVTAAVLNEVLERRQRERWAVLAQYALFEFVRTARLVWSGLLELADLVPDGELGDEALAAGSEAVRDTPRLTAAMDEMLASADRREQLHRLIGRLLGRGEEVLGRWADVLVNSGTYAEIRRYAADEALFTAGDLGLARTAFSEAAAAAAELGLALRLPQLDERPAPQRQQRRGCDWPWTSAYVTHRGDVQPCCMVMGSERATLGSVSDRSFADVWRGRAYRAFRRRLESDDPPDVCRGCSLYRGVF